MQPTLPHDFALLALRDIDGKFAIGKTELDVTLAGGVLADLALRGHLDLAANRLCVSDASSTGSDVLDYWLSQIAVDPKPRKPQWWVNKIKAKELRQKVVTDLVEAGQLRHEASTVLGLFPVERYPALSTAREQVVRAAVSAALNGATPSEGIALMTALLDASGLLKKEFGRVDRARVKQIIDGAWSGKAVKAVIDSIHAATMAAVSAASAAAASN